jgi:hypothetical protein
VGAKQVSGKPYYLVKWLGYPDSANTWEPVTNILNNKIVEQWQLSQTKDDVTSEGQIKP